MVADVEDLKTFKQQCFVAILVDFNVLVYKYAKPGKPFLAKTVHEMLRTINVYLTVIGIC